MVYQGASHQLKAPEFQLDISHWPCSLPTTQNGVSMMVTTQSLSGDGATPDVNIKDLHNKIKFATWNVMTPSGTSYQVALVHELARFNLSCEGITEDQIPSSGQYSTEDALLLHSEGDHHINGVALITRPAFSNTLVSWQPFPWQ